MWQRTALRARLMHRAWRYRLRTERPEVAFVRRHLAAHQTAIDVGAHRGAFIYWMLRAVGDAEQVVAVEPIPELAAYLRTFGDVGGYSRLQVVEAALSDAPGTRHAPCSGGRLSRYGHVGGPTRRT